MNDHHEANRKGWDAVSPGWQANIDAQGIWRRCHREPELVLTPEEMEFLRDVAGKDVCVLGSGDNVVAFALAGMGARVTSVDISQVQLDTAAHRGALDAGFPEQSLLTTEAAAAWRKWRDEVGSYKPEINAESHDTISMLAIDRGGDLSGACTTSGMKWKMSGRVGDSPIIGAALFVDNAVGAACATGLGEAVMKTCGSFLVVENMRRGMGPEAACRDALQRIADTNPHSAELQVGYIALTRDGRVGGHAIQPGFSFAVRDGERVETIDAPSLL